MKRLNKKGFTLVELLAVIVILAVVMLIGVTAIGPIQERARKKALADEAIGLVDAAKLAYADSGKTCYTLAELYKAGYYSKNVSDYSGKVVIGNDPTTGSVAKIYTVSISNGKYKIDGKEVNTLEDVANVSEGSATYTCS